jgi:hypothetical protein
MPKRPTRNTWASSPRTRSLRADVNSSEDASTSIKSHRSDALALTREGLPLKVAGPKRARPRAAALTACVAIVVHSTGGEGVEWDRSLGPPHRFTKSGIFPTRPSDLTGGRTATVHKRVDAVGGAVTPPTAFQSVSEQPHDQGRRLSSSRCAAVHRPSVAALRWGCCQTSALICASEEYCSQFPEPFLTGCASAAQTSERARPGQTRGGLGEIQLSFHAGRSAEGDGAAARKRLRGEAASSHAVG